MCTQKPVVHTLFRVTTLVPWFAQIAAVALMLDYIVTVAIQSAAGVAAIISTFPSLHTWKIANDCTCNWNF
jgi:hypothetical protein